MASTGAPPPAVPQHPKTLESAPTQQRECGGTHALVASTGAPPPAEATTRTRRPAGARRRHSASRVWHRVEGPSQWPGTTLCGSAPPDRIRHTRAREHDGRRQGARKSALAHTDSRHSDAHDWGTCTQMLPVCACHRRASGMHPGGTVSSITMHAWGGTRARARPRTGCGWRKGARPGRGGPRTRPAAPPPPAPPPPAAGRPAAGATAGPSRAAAGPARQTRKGQGGLCKGLASLVSYSRLNSGV